MNCGDFRDKLEEFKAGRLAPDEQRAAEAHRAACAACARRARRYGRPPRLVAFGFVGAFAASIFTLIYTGLSVRDADTVEQEGPAAEAPAREDAGDASAAPEPESPEDEQAPDSGAAPARDGR